MNHPIIEIEHLSKHFGPVHAVQDLSFQVREGELFAFLGINGAGKSTTISILCGQLAKDAGTVRIGGVNLDRDPDAVKRSLGVVFVPSFKLGGTIETTGAGDTFCASVLNFVLENGIACLTPEDREAMLRFANGAAYIVTTRKGAIRSMPERSEVEALLAAN